MIHYKTALLPLLLFLMTPFLMNASEAQLEKSEQKSPPTLEFLCMRAVMAKTQRKGSWAETIWSVNPVMRPGLIAVTLVMRLLAGDSKTDLVSFVYRYPDYRVRTEILTRVLLHPRVPKKAKLEFITFLDETAKHFGGESLSPESEYPVIAFFKQLLSQENVINIQHLMVKRNLFIEQDAYGKRAFCLNASPLTNKSGVVYSSPLMTEALKHECFLLVDVLTALGAVPCTLDRPADYAGVVGSIEGNDYGRPDTDWELLNPPTTSALDHLVCTLNPQFIKNVFQCWANKKVFRIKPDELFRAFSVRNMGEIVSL